MKKYRIFNQVDHVRTYEEAASLLVRELPKDIETNELRLTIFTEPNGRWSAIAERVEFSVKVGDVLQTHKGKYRYVMHDRGSISTFDSAGDLCLAGQNKILKELRNGSYRCIGRNIFDVFAEWEALQ